MKRFANIVGKPVGFAMGQTVDNRIRIRAILAVLEESGVFERGAFEAAYERVKRDQRADLVRETREELAEFLRDDNAPSAR